MTKLTSNGDGTTTLDFQQGETSAFHIDIYTDEAETEGAVLTNYSARGMGRQKYGTIATSPVLFNISCTIENNRVSCVILPSESSSISITTGVYDVEIYNTTDSDIVYRVLQGVWNMSQEVTV